ncbi:MULTISPECIES: CBS domain-containing protein [Halolamina]|uniref:CBS domain-containing protein n=1 Tax=Halolamina pelagica TaxID=699431 RepID=A0A1I5QQL2_9EURY|nr:MULTISPECIES: CBS domain-containing protein [Halolamina]NHX35486.1 CBS domain-containing protein [Halolamina sp. R1-12]SFP48311.1 CBS domain-containing protein [Halolamina pelagica]
MNASDVMTADVETVAPDDEVGEVLARLADVNFSGFPVVDEDDRVVGVVTEGDLVNLFEVDDRVLWIPIGIPPIVDTLTYAFDLPGDDVDIAAHADDPISSVMTPDPVTVDADATVDELLDLLANPEQDINRLPVLDGGKLVGIITRQDLLRGLKRERGAAGAA